jgi:hypothetical protein
MLCIWSPTVQYSMPINKLPQPRSFPPRGTRWFGHVGGVERRNGHADVVEPQRVRSVRVHSRLVHVVQGIEVVLRAVERIHPLAEYRQDVFPDIEENVEVGLDGRQTQLRGQRRVWIDGAQQLHSTNHSVFERLQTRCQRLLMNIISETRSVTFHKQPAEARAGNKAAQYSTQYPRGCMQ